MIDWGKLISAAGSFGLSVREEHDCAIIYSGPVVVANVKSWHKYDSIESYIPKWVTHKNNDRSRGRLDDLNQERALYESYWPLLAAACPLSILIVGDTRVGLESIAHMRYYRHSITSELDEYFEEFTKIEARLAAHAADKLSVRRSAGGSHMISEIFGVIKYDHNPQRDAVESREYVDLEEHLPEWYKGWHLGRPLTCSAYEKHFNGELARLRAEYTARYPALAAEWKLEIWTFGYSTTEYYVADCTFERLEDVADTLRAWDSYYAEVHVAEK